MRRGGRPRARASRPSAFLGLATLLAAGPLGAQEPPRPPEREVRASPEFAAPFLPRDHWAAAAARRLYGMGMAGSGFDPGRRALGRREVGVLLHRAAAAAADDTSREGRLARAFYARFAEEFPATAAAIEADAGLAARAADASVLAGVEVRRGSVRAGSGYYNDDGWRGPVPAGEAAGALVAAAVSGALMPHLAALLAPVLREGRMELADAHVVAVWHGVGVWAGRRPVGFGPGVGGAVVLDAAVPFDGGGLFLARPVKLPGPLGSARFETFVSRMEQNGAVPRPWVWAARASLSPHARLSLGVNRAAVFGGSGNGEFSLRNLAYVIVGKHGGEGSEFDNQIIALDAVFRPPLGPVPVLLYAEWGFEDSAGAWKDVPALVAGIEVPAVPGIEEVALGVERTSFAGSCCGNPIWYRHWAFEDGWTDGGVPLGHPLGGHGAEWLIHARADLHEARLRVAGRLFARRRGAENLFAPDRAGTSRGAAVAAELRLLPGWEAVARAFFEQGERDWRETRVLTGLRALF